MSSAGATPRSIKRRGRRGNEPVVRVLVEVSFSRPVIRLRGELQERSDEVNVWERRTSVKSFILLYNGPTTPPEVSHEGWPEWFQSIGDKLNDVGSPMANGFVVHSDGTTSDNATSFNGYSIIRAEDRDEVLDVVRDHPFLAVGGQYTIEVFDVPSK